jgi:TPR repeat protein
MAPTLICQVEDMSLFFSTGNAMVGVNKDPQEAFNWYRRAADAGSVDSMAHLAYMYYSDKDYKQAFSWYRKAADSGDVSEATAILTGVVVDGERSPEIQITFGEAQLRRLGLGLIGSPRSRIAAIRQAAIAQMWRRDRPRP